MFFITTYKNKKIIEKKIIANKTKIIQKNTEGDKCALHTCNKNS